MSMMRCISRSSRLFFSSASQHRCWSKHLGQQGHDGEHDDNNNVVACVRVR